MKVFFSCSSKDIVKYKQNYQAIRNTILKHGYEITRDWIIETIKRNESGIKEPPRSNLYTEVMDAIKNADVIIIDSTVPNMSVGYQLAYSLEKSKPTLLLHKKEIGSVEDYLVAGCKSGFLTIKSYSDEEDIINIVEKFLEKHVDSSKIRFNLVLDQYQNDYIENVAHKERKTKTDVIREAIDKKIKELTK